MPKVKDGDCMVSLADGLGMQDYHTLYDAAENAALKQKRPNPNHLVVGDDFQDPPKKGKVHSRAVDQTWVFVLKTKKLPKLRLVVVDPLGKPLAGKAWSVKGPKDASGKSASTGLVEVADLPAQPTTGSLELTWQKSKPPKKAPAEKDSKVKKPTYPRAIKLSEFKDDPVDPPKAEDDVIRFELRIGSLPPFDTEAGVRARLHNLGSVCKPDSDAVLTKKSVKAFQRARLDQKTPSGATADIQTPLRDLHDTL